MGQCDKVLSYLDYLNANDLEIGKWSIPKGFFPWVEGIGRMSVTPTGLRYGGDAFIPGMNSWAK